MNGKARWSRLKRDIEALMDPKVKFQIYSNSYKNGSGQEIGRFWITIGDKIVFDFPKNYLDEIGSVYFTSNFTRISQTIRDYINTPREKIFNPEIIGLPMRINKKALIHILRACDRRVGKAKLQEMLDSGDYVGVEEIINKRLSGE